MFVCINASHGLWNILSHTHANIYHVDTCNYYMAV